MCVCVHNSLLHTGLCAVLPFAVHYMVLEAIIISFREDSLYKLCNTYVHSRFIFTQLAQPSLCVFVCTYNQAVISTDHTVKGANVKIYHIVWSTAGESFAYIWRCRYCCANAQKKLKV